MIDPAFDEGWPNMGLSWVHCGQCGNSVPHMYYRNIPIFGNVTKLFWNRFRNRFKCWLFTGGNCVVRNFARACNVCQTGECAPCVSKYRNTAFSYLEQWSPQLFFIWNIASKYRNVSINGTEQPVHPTGLEPGKHRNWGQCTSTVGRCLPKFIHNIF